LWRRENSGSVVIIAGQEGDEGCKTVRSRVARRCEGEGKVVVGQLVAFAPLA